MSFTTAIWEPMDDVTDTMSVFPGCKLLAQCQTKLTNCAYFYDVQSEHSSTTFEPSISILECDVKEKVVNLRLGDVKI